MRDKQQTRWRDITYRDLLEVPVWIEIVLSIVACAILVGLIACNVL